MAAESKALRAIRSALRAAARPEDTAGAARFFKTDPGEYAEGDVFLGVRVPDTRRLVPSGDTLEGDDVVALLRSPIHEERLLALLILIRRYQRKESAREEIVATFLRERRFINNWDLVDTAAPPILGAWLLTRDRGILLSLAQSPNLWERRIAILATLTFIRANDFAWTLDLARRLRGDREDLIHKAVGWMLREVGKRDAGALRSFLDETAFALPRTMLRYAIEKLPAADRATYLAARRPL